MTGRNIHNEELNLQYRAQADVIGQLEDKLRRLISSQQQNSSSNIALTKLQRDFERVQNRAKALTDGMARLQAEKAKQPEPQVEQEEQTSYFQQMQIQLQQDVSMNDSFRRAPGRKAYLSLTLFSLPTTTATQRRDYERTRGRNSKHQSRYASSERNLQRFGSYCRVTARSD